MTFGHRDEAIDWLAERLEAWPGAPEQVAQVERSIGVVFLRSPAAVPEAASLGGYRISCEEWFVSRCAMRAPGDPSPAVPPGAVFECADDGKRVERAGVKYDGDKAQYDLLFADMPLALEEAVLVLTYGAKKYAAANWERVENAERRYQAAGLRHEVAHAQGEQRDTETGRYHLAHKICCDLFRLELMMREEVAHG